MPAPSTRRVEAQETLEALIDAHSLAGVLFMLAAVCEEKAEHIRANWQDKVTARPWANAATRIEKVARLFGI